jgi:flagellar biosynthesis/type III secretory pathway protein FliH
MGGSDDINDLFDSITFSEDRLVEDGYQEGFNQGALQGEQDGFHLGFQKGKELGQELGFYQGFAEGWILELNKGETKKPERALNQLEKLLVLINKFPKENTKDEDITELIGEVRAKFKTVCSMLKVSSEFESKDISW